MTNTQLTQMALSAILRCKEQIDIFDLCYILRGRSTQTIKQKGFDKIKTFGAGKVYSRYQWHHMFIQMIQQNYFVIDYEESYHLKVTQKGYQVLNGELKVANLIIDRQAIRLRDRSFDPFKGEKLLGPRAGSFF